MSSRRGRPAARDLVSVGGSAGENGTSAVPTLSVLRVSHSGVVTAWRERDRALRALGARETLVTACRWNEGGAMVELDTSATQDEPTVGIRTVGRHPFRFVYDPIALWRVLRATPF